MTHITGMTRCPSHPASAAPPDDAPGLLAIPEDRPDLLFPEDPAASADRWKALVRRWHPDRNAAPDAAAVFARLAALKATAERWRAEGRWRSADSLWLRGCDCRRRRLRFRAHRPFELGEMLIARTCLHLLYAPAQGDLAANAARRIAGLAFADRRMQREMRGRLPVLAADFETPGGRVQVLEKQADMVRLADLVAHAGGRLPPRHLAWILGGMLHLACYLDWAGLAHNAIGPETWFVSPERHAGALLGGWSYAVGEGARLLAAPARTVAAASSRWRRDGRAEGRLDRELIRLTGREIAGDSHALPAAMRAWLANPAPPDALEDYADWTRALRESFGPPRFARLNLRAEAVYPA